MSLLLLQGSPTSFSKAASLITPQQMIDSLPQDSWCRDWIDSFPASESPVSFILLSGLSMLGACIGRRCWHQEDYRLIYPMSNLLLIGPSGIGKSSSLEMARDFLLYNLPEDNRPQFVGGASTMEGLHQLLEPQPHAILYASELAAFFNRSKYMESLIPYSTELLDYPPQVERNLRTGKSKVIAPSVTILGGSTKDWLTSALPDTAVGGGFLPRFLVVMEEEKRQRIANAEMALSSNQWKIAKDVREGAIASFPYLVSFHQGNIPFTDYATSDLFAEWYNAHKPSTGHLAPFAARAKVSVRRLAMLLALSSRRGEITESDLSSAIAIYSYTEQKLQEVIVPNNPIGRLISSVLSSIPPQGATMQEICRANRNLMHSQDVQKYLNSLRDSGDIQFEEGKFIRKEQR